MKTIFKFKNLSIIESNSQEISKNVAKQFSDLVKIKANCVLGLATGSSPIPIYKEMIKLHQEEKVNYFNVKTYNLDEYIGLQEQDKKQSYYQFMFDNLFNGINIDPNNVNFPNKVKNNIYSEYDEAIKQDGGIDVQLLGLGVNGHIAFNEPGTSNTSLTHLTKITKSTIVANARFFDGEMKRVPKEAITMGIQSILNAKKIILVATGKNKALAISKISLGITDKKWPCTWLLKHKNVEIFVDKEASSLIN